MKHLTIFTAFYNTQYESSSIAPPDAAVLALTEQDWESLEWAQETILRLSDSYESKPERVRTTLKPPTLRLCVGSLTMYRRTCKTSNWEMLIEDAEDATEAAAWLNRLATPIPMDKVYFALSINAVAPEIFTLNLVDANGDVLQGAGVIKGTANPFKLTLPRNDKLTSLAA